MPSTMLPQGESADTVDRSPSGSVPWGARRPRNEGLPLVCLEAISCGANAVGSAVGGIPEAVGESNVVPLGDDFVDGMSQKILQMLKHPENQSVPAHMSWENATSVELGHILSLK